MAGRLVLQDGGVERALDPRLEEAVQVEQPQDILVVVAADAHVAVEHDLAFGQRAGLVAAEDLDAAEVLDGRELFDEDLLLGHPPGTLGQGDRDDRRHHLGGHADRERDREEERLEQRAVEKDVDQQDEEDEGHDDPRDHQPEVADAPTELGLRRPRRQPLGDLAEGSFASGGDDDRGADPRLDGGPEEDAVARLGHTVRPLRKLPGDLFDRERLAGQRGLAHLKVLDVEQTGVRRHEVSCVELDDVAGDQVRDRQLLLLPVADDGGGGGDLLPDRLHRVTRLELHEEVQQHTEQDHRDDDQATDRVAQRDRDDAGHQKNDDEGIGEEA